MELESLQLEKLKMDRQHNILVQPMNGELFAYFFHLFLCTIFYEFWFTFLFRFHFRLLVEGKLAQFKSEERIRLLTALKNYNEALMERATLLDKNSRLSRHNAELKMLLNLDNN